MDNYLSFFWFVAAVTSWISFGYASWKWADNPAPGALILTVLWFVMSLALFLIGLRLRKTQ